MAELGTCNVCSAPCTSCMHFKRLITGVKSEIFSGEASCDNTSSLHSASKSAVVNPLKKHAFDNLQDTATATSSYASLSENIRNNETGGSNTSGEVSRRKFENDFKEGNVSNPGGTKLELREIDFARNDTESLVVSNSDRLVKPKIIKKLKTEGEKRYISEEPFDVVRTSMETSDDPAELTDVTEPSSDSHSGDESDEIVEQDVNICDICGDAGREDLLATCSGCSDGAEHTYCMQEKMEKVPESEWFCEECRLAEKSQKQRDICDEVVKVPPISRLRSLRRNLSLKLDLKESSVEGNSTEIYTPGTQSCKRQLERVESSTGVKRQATDIERELSVSSSPHHTARDGPFKSGAHEKVNKLYQPSHGTKNVGSRLQTHKGLLSKSNSFDAVSLKSKEKSIDDITRKHKTHREYTDAQDGANRLMARSMSLRPVHLGQPNTSESKVTMLSPKSSHAPEVKGFKKSKEYISYDRKKSFRDERSSSMSRSLSEASDPTRKTASKNGVLSLGINSRDSKANQSDEKVSPLTKLTAHATHSALDVPERKLNKPHGKEESTSGTWTTTMHISNADVSLNPEMRPPQDASYQAVKNADNNLTRSRLGNSISGSNLCQRCKEPITAAHVCMISGPRSSASDPSTVKIPADDMEKMNPVKAALHAAFLKKSIISKKRKAPDHEQFDEKPITRNWNGQNCPQDSKNTSSAENKHIQKLPLNNFSYARGQDLSIDHFSHSFSLSRKMQVTVGGDGMPIGNAVPCHSMAHLCTASTTAIPVHEYIWQGDFEVNRNGEKVAADMHPGFQAHLSSFASPKVVEVVHKLSPRLSLTATPRLSTWPEQFYETGATEDNIALYFFAKDIESYERYYKVLLDNMMRNDLALIGDANGVEILIFPSSQLPQKFQRWNMLFFMWGVFRAKKRNFHCEMASISKNLDASGKSCIIASHASPSIPMPPRPVALKHPDCELVRDALSGHSASYTRSLLKKSTADSPEEEHVVDMECEVKPNSGLNGKITVTDRPAMLGNKCTPALKSSASSAQSQELENYLVNEGKEVDGVMIGCKVKKEDGDAKPSLKKEPSMRDVSVKNFDCVQSSNKNHCDGDIRKVSCRDSDTEHVELRCSTSDAHETTGSRNSSKKIMYDLNLDAVDMMEESDAAESARALGFTGWDLNSSANDIQVDDGDTEAFPLPLFVGMGEGSAGKKEEAPVASLSLSLGLPF